MRTIRSWTPFFLIFILLFNMNNHSSNAQDLWSKKFEIVDSFIFNDQPQSAYTYLEKEIKNKIPTKDEIWQIKLNIYQAHLKNQLSETPTKKVIILEQSFQQAKTPLSRQILAYMIAEEYNNYYQSNRYQIDSRTKVDNNSSGIKDIETWSSNTFQEKIEQYYTIALQDTSLLRSTAVATLQPLIHAGKNSEGYVLNAYDIMAEKVMDYYSQKINGHTWNTIFNRLDNQSSLTSLQSFQNHKYWNIDVSNDEEKMALTYLKMWQDRMKNYATSQQIPALNRLYIVRTYQLMQALNAVHKKTITQNFNQLWKNNASAETALAYVYIQRDNGYDEPENYSLDIKSIVEQLDIINHKYPNSEAATLAVSLKAQWSQKFINIQSEQVLLPNVNNKFLVEYKNVAQLEYSIVPITLNEFQIINSGHGSKVLLDINSKKHTGLNKIPLPKWNDYKKHSMEVLIPPQTFGRYAIVIINPDYPDSIYAMYPYQVSNLALIENTSVVTEYGYYVLDRTNGNPIMNASLSFLKLKYNNNVPQFSVQQTINTNALGKAITNLKADQNYVQIISGKDTLIHGIYKSYKENAKHDIITHSILFTDRSIYRPGQKVYFKGIVYKDVKKNDNQVLPNYTITVTLRDANYEEIDSIKLTTNEFGSYTGSFNIPVGVLNGDFKISDNINNTYCKVEEYKRPTFTGEIEPYTGSYRLNDTIQLKGLAKAFAGNAIQGAKVKYSISRNTYFPYWRRGMYYPNRSETSSIAVGEVLTDEKGYFTIPLPLIPDLSIDQALQPSFTYNIEADITDMNGETHAVSNQFTANASGLNLDINVPKDASLLSLKNIDINIKNTANQPIKRSGIVRISKLKDVGLLKERYWPKPDITSWDASTFASLFPYDVYENENKLEVRPIENVVQIIEIDDINNAKLDLSDKKHWKKNGYYALELLVKGDDGKEVIKREIFHFYDALIKGNPEKALSIISNKYNTQPQDEISVAVLSSKKDIYPLVSEKNIHTTKLIENKRYWERFINESDRGGIGYSSLMVYNNRIYTANTIIDIPWTNKDLNITWETHRDKYLPGSKEVWKMKITGAQKDRVTAELLSVLYDASLDAINPHDYKNNLLRYDKVYGNLVFRNFSDFGTNHVWQKYSFLKNDYTTKDYYVEYPYLISEIYNNRYARHMAAPVAMRSIAMDASNSVNELESVAVIGYQKNSKEKYVGAAERIEAEKNNDTVEEMVTTKATSSLNNDMISIRKNFNETAYFIPQLHTDKEGNVELSFTLPESVTKWKMMSLAHTKDMKMGYLQGNIVTQKDLMVQPNMPRYFRQKDQVVLSARLVNMTDEVITIQPNLQILDPETMQDLQKSFHLINTNNTVSIPANGTMEYQWNLSIPEARYEPVLVRVHAASSQHTDGEEHLLPVLTNRTLVTESTLIAINGSGEKSVTVPALQQRSNTQTPLSYTIEYTANPTWLVVQSLPYLTTYPYECSEQIFSKIYANALSRKIVKDNPAIIYQYKQWMKDDTTSLTSKLNQNQELKNVILQNSPWVADAKKETDQMRQVAQLFDAKQIESQLDYWSNKLYNRQNSDGGWAWFDGMHSNTFITQQIVNGYGKLHQVKAWNESNEHRSKMNKAWQYLENQLIEWHEFILKQEKNADVQSKVVIGYAPNVLNYFYGKMLYNMKSTSNNTKLLAAETYFYNQLKKSVQQQNILNKAQLAMVTHFKGDNTLAKQVVQSLKETAIQNEQLGVYWKNNQAGYQWYEAPIEAQAAVIEAFNMIAPNDNLITGMKNWLLKQKQVQHWGTTKSTVDATYALLKDNQSWLTDMPQVKIATGTYQYELNDKNTVSGTGYFKQRIAGSQVTKDMSTVQVSVKQPVSAKDRTSWGAIYYQYFEDMDKIQSYQSGINIQKELFIKQSATNGSQLVKITDNTPIKLGDRVTVRIVMNIDRTMEFVHLQDMRASAFEPVNSISGYQYNNGLGYYQSIGDAQINFFFDRINKGTYVFEYDVYATASGNYSNGISKLQNMYAPELGAHTIGQRVEIKK